MNRTAFVRAMLRGRHRRDSPAWASPNRHPLQIIRAVLDAAGVPADLYDASSLDPSTVAYQRVAHYSCG